MNNYNQSLKRKLSKKKYANSEKGKLVKEKYDNSEKGKLVKKRASRKQRLKPDQINRWADNLIKWVDRKEKEKEESSLYE